MEFIKDNIILITVLGAVIVILLSILVLSILTYKRVKLRKPDKKEIKHRRRRENDEDIFD